ncbi:SDR family NAD(P)-dependent oxidoreductase [Rhodobacteraceae bacterium 2376]|uniref:SDR family NAD(P)-dependent oxidoreductase n=1 Tax=Rhabdonatronobacter sediminivivens TaxID=2743469 RepID=A0A7Z0HXD6_9RHOB|nr:SDR family NAD(P)-dependent oxidoreductase [Rhabdonatronobacter sediminivivens]NYS23807.1 SDR family NAD(P)-dependent oxidoreductase [Rhabdonatronobacter sediminivivens]
MDHVLITGAARGIGRALALSYAREGAQVVACTRGAAPPDAGIDWQQADVTDPQALQVLAGRLERPVDLLICNAGVYLDKHMAPGDLTPQIWAQSFAINVAGVFWTVQAMRPHLRPGARIAILGSIMGSSAHANGGAYVYRASKAAVLNLGRNLATDLRDEGIAVGVYHPGWVRTDMGGSGADIGLDAAVAGLRTRFAALDLARSGVFEAHDGTALAF